MKKPTFRNWLKANLDKRQRIELASHGADSGWPGLSYTVDCVKLFDKYEDEIWDGLTDIAEQSGYRTVLLLLARHRRVDMADVSIGSFKALCVWTAAEYFCCEEGG